MKKTGESFKVMAVGKSSTKRHPHEHFHEFSVVYGRPTGVVVLSDNSPLAIWARAKDISVHRYEKSSGVAQQMLDEVDAVIAIGVDIKHPVLKSAHERGKIVEVYVE